MVETMNRENESIAGKEAAIDDSKHKTERDLSIYGSVFYTDAYRKQMNIYKKNAKKRKDKGGK